MYEFKDKYLHRNNMTQSMPRMRLMTRLMVDQYSRNDRDFHFSL